MLTKLTILISTVFWPYQIVATNNTSDILKFTLPAVLLLVSLYFYTKNNDLFFVPLLFTPLIEPKLAIFPVLFLIVFAYFQKKINKKLLFAVLVSLILLTVSWKGFVGQTIFQLDYERQQEIIRDTKLYDSVFLARMFHNKARIVIDKFNHNFFALIDPNNYFFGFAPRQIVENQNLIKYPFVFLPFFLYGIWKIKSNKHNNFIIISFISGLFSLSVLTVFDKNDFLLWLPITLLINHGIKEFNKNYPTKWVPFAFTLSILLSIPELIRVLIR